MNKNRPSRETLRLAARRAVNPFRKRSIAFLDRKKEVRRKECRGRYQR